MTNTRRVVVTGIGLVSSLGIGTESNWAALVAGRSGIGPITHFDAAQFATRIAGEVRAFDPLRFIEKKDVKKMDVFIPSAIINLAAGQVSIRFGAKGPNSATCTACSASAHAIGDAFEIIRRGDADVMIAGGSEAAITPMGIGGFCAPDRASRPFDKDRDGFVVGEGAGVLILEELEAAQRRGARVYAELVGYGMS